MARPDVYGKVLTGQTLMFATGERVGQPERLPLEGTP